MIQTETSKAKIIFVSVPNDVFQYRLSTIGVRLVYESKSKGIDYLELPQGNWTILNVLDDVTEDEAKMVVDRMPFSFSDRYRDYKTAYIYSKPHVNTAKQSIHSLATSLGVEGKTIILYELKH